MNRRRFLLALAAFPGWRSVGAAAGDALPGRDSGASSDPDRVADPGSFAPVRRGQRLAFPADHGAHPDFRHEWWYAAGWLALPDGAPLGFQATFFRVRTGIGERSASAFAPRQLVLAHAAIADPRHGRLMHEERAARIGFGRAGFAGGRTAVWIGDWRLDQAGGVYRVEVPAGAFACSLALVAVAPPLLHGVAGFSAKAAEPRHASYYYSRPQLAASGTVNVAGRRLAVSGRAWLDHEWASELLPDAAQGWDWTGINLHDGGALMAFRLRRPDGRALWAGATLRAGDGAVQVLPPAAVAFEPLRRWRSARTGIAYPVEWRLRVGRRVFHLQPLIDDQELDSRGVVYWEGAVRLLADGGEVGRGYLELTGYGERLRLD